MYKCECQKSRYLIFHRKRGDKMKKIAKIGIIIMVVLLLSSCSAIKEDEKFIVVASNEYKVMSFDSQSLEVWKDEAGKSYIDVWVQQDMINTGSVAVKDLLLWHIDVEGDQYKVSDSYSYDGEDKCVEA